MPSLIWGHKALRHVRGKHIVMSGIECWATAAALPPPLPAQPLERSLVENKSKRTVSEYGCDFRYYHGSHGSEVNGGLKGAFVARQNIPEI